MCIKENIYMYFEMYILSKYCTHRMRFAIFARFKDFRKHVINYFFTIGEKNHLIK